MAKRVLIVGGVAGGASCAARLRRLDEKCEIVLFERGPFVSFANCGLPYHVGGVIPEEKSLLVATPELFKERFNIQVRLEHEVLRVDRADKTIEVRHPGGVSRESYDALVLATGASPAKPPLPGIDLPGIFTVRSIPDTRRIKDWIRDKKARRALVVGAGFIGVEMAENLRGLGLDTTLLEAASRILPVFDPEMTTPLHQGLRDHGVELILSDPVASFERAADGLCVRTQGGKKLDADLVVLSIGVQPETVLAREAGLELGLRGGVRVDGTMRTNDPSIWAVGDMVETRDHVTGEWVLMPLAGPANRQGRLAAESVAGRPRSFRGVQGTAVCGFFGLTAALTGATEGSLKHAGITDYEKVYLHPGNHAEYYPGAQALHLKLLFSTQDGRVLGLQAVGTEGVEKRVDVAAMAIQMGATVYDLEEAELSYAPQYGTAKDPVNLAGMVAANLLRGDVKAADWGLVGKPGKQWILDVRSPREFAAGHVPNAVNIPVDELRSRLGELPNDQEIWVYCGVGKRSYVACRILRQSGFDARNLSGGYQTYRMFNP